jgi:hypothetical protein
MTINYEMLPEHMQHGAREYVEHGIPQGDFLMAVLENDLVEAFARADMTNRFCMHKWAEWLYNQCPRMAWGSKAKVDAWIVLHQEARDRKAKATP